MPRHNQSKRTRHGRSQPAAERAAVGDPFARQETGPRGEAFNVRTIPASRALKIYRCPGCDHEIRPGTTHIVAWPDQDWGGPDERRHWHAGCWSGRASRGITRRWS